MRRFQPVSRYFALFRPNNAVFARIALYSLLFALISPYSALAGDAKPVTACLKEMNAKQCTAWKEFWPEFQKAALDSVNTMAPTEHLMAPRAKVTDFTTFPFTDYFRGSLQNYGAPVTAQNKEQFLAMYDRIFNSSIMSAVKRGRYHCTSEGADVVETPPDCNHVYIENEDTASAGITLEFSLEKDGRYHLTDIPSLP